MRVLSVFLLICAPAMADTAPCGGSVIAKAYTKALAECASLAKEGSAEAQFYLGLMYSNGYGDAQDKALAESWYKKAADQGLATAEYNLGVMYYRGEGIPKDWALAVSWFRKAADQGFAAAQFNLGVMYYRGEGVPKDWVLAYMWANLAAATTEQDQKLRDDLEKLMTPSQIAESQKLSREWKPKN